MLNIKQYSETLHYISFNIFNTNFDIRVPSKRKYTKTHIKEYIKDLISEVQFEHFKPDSNKKVLLFYKPSKQNNHLVDFVFAVEADETLLELKKSNKVKAMIDYLFENEKNLNFKV